MSTLTFAVFCEEMTCGKCGGVFALNKDFLTYARRSAGGYHCPYCQTRWSWEQSEADRLRKQLEETEAKLRESRCETLQQQHRADGLLESANKLTRKLARVSKGVCPCCKRSFTNLRRHMATRHANEQPTKP